MATKYLTIDTLDSVVTSDGIVFGKVDTEAEQQLAAQSPTN